VSSVATVDKAVQDETKDTVKNWDEQLATLTENY